MVSAFASMPMQIKTIMHEVIHLWFFGNYTTELKRRGLTQKQIMNINEALVELLNLEFKDLCPIPEKDNKPSTNKLKHIIRGEYDKLDFKKLLNELIDAELE